MKKVRVRFAPSPTGGLHVGGLRTALYNYLFAKKNNGTFYIRIEDTDQERLVPGAEKYIFDALNWLGINPDETIGVNEVHGPYKQSLRGEIYNSHIQRLLDNGKAYYAFETSEELQILRDGNQSFRYDYNNRETLNNSTNINVDTISMLLKRTPYTIRLVNNPGRTIIINDEIRGEVKFATEYLDDKILVKKDGLPTYHLANVIDDHHMETTHVIRGEEWLPSLPFHILIYEAFGWDAPKFAHLPLILKPNGEGKISKRDAIEGGFPILPLNWSEELKGYKECGYEVEAIINFIATSSWNNKDNREIYSLTELISAFDLKNISKAGARYDVDKLNWFNNHYFQNTADSVLHHKYIAYLNEQDNKYLSVDSVKIMNIIKLTKHRFNNINDFFEQNMYLFEQPSSYDTKVLELMMDNGTEHLHFLSNTVQYSVDDLKNKISTYTNEYAFKTKNIMQLFRYALVGTLSGADIFDIVNILGTDETILRLNNLIEYGV